MRVREDERLVRRLRRGDEDALRRIYEKYRDDMLTIATCLLRDAATAEDCLHDVFVQLAAGAAEFRLRRSFKGYLVTCIANRARDQLRKNSRQVALGEAENLLVAHNNPRQEASNGEEAERLFRMVLELPYEQREVITLRLHGGQKFREIAEQLGLSINTVQSRYRYGLDKLRVLLAGGEPR